MSYYVLSDKKEQISLVDAVYPIGSYYISDNSTSPASIFGGGWEQLNDRMLIGIGSTFTADNREGGAYS